MPQTLTPKVAPPSPDGNAAASHGAHPDDTTHDLPLDGPDLVLPSNAPLMRREVSECWLPARVARRLVERHGPELAGRLALAQRHRHGVGRPGHWVRLDATRWVYWDVVCIAIERQTGIRFRSQSCQQAEHRAQQQAAS